MKWRRWLLCALLCGCTEQERVKNWGGNMNIDLAAGQKLVTATWKEDDFWYLTRARRADEPVETYVFHESASYGTLQGTVTLREHK